jgi:DNA-binding IclR family transcriptional regulator
MWDTLLVVPSVPADSAGASTAINVGTDSSTGVGVLDKAVAILRAVAGEGQPVDLAALQHSTGLPRATAHRLAVALETQGMLRRDAAGRFCLGFELIRLGRQASDQFPLAELAAPVLQDLRASTGESVQLFVRDGDQRRCVASLESLHGLRWIVPQGAVLPLDRGSAGRVLLGESALIESVEEREAGVASVSAAVRGSVGDVVAALSVSGPVERMTRAPLLRFGDVLVDAAQRLHERLSAAR